MVGDGVPGRFNGNYDGVDEDRGPWAAGLYWVSTGETRLFQVEKRDGGTLKAIITDNVLPQTKVVTDEWRGYNLETLQDAAGDMDLEHDTVCHEVNFVDPTTGAHTQNIEQAWQKAKSVLVRTGGHSRALLQSHLNWVWWASVNGRTKCQDPFLRLVEAVARQYPQK
ncbi:hypothetical protein V5799_022630 [Amblyomma americanum]|uniref:ISXO2-like transposase domain-containing protein n=1 Tax=Amblyomma americanum TaxID=6943 RepID=A0AAQ4FM85_AMBAM